MHTIMVNEANGIEQYPSFLYHKSYCWYWKREGDGGKFVQTLIIFRRIGQIAG